MKGDNLTFRFCDHCQKDKDGTQYLSVKFKQQSGNWTIIEKFLCPECVKEYEVIKEEKLGCKAIEATIPLSKALAEGVPPINWRIESLLPTPGILTIASPPGTYKTFTALNIALCVATGRDLYDQFTVEQGRVLYIDEENSRGLILNRVEALLKGSEITQSLEEIFLCQGQQLRLDTNEGANILLELIQAYMPNVVILDSLVRFMDGDEDKARDVRKLFETLKREMDEDNEISFIILHHTRKGKAGKNGDEMDGLRGSGDLSAQADVIAMLSPKGNNSFLFTVVKNRVLSREENPPFIVKVINHNEGLRFEYGGAKEKSLSMIERVKDDLAAWFSEAQIKEFYTKDALAKMQQKAYNRTSFYDALSEFRSEQVIRPKGRGQYEVLKHNFSVDKL